jgi:hypothetical protein
VQPTTRIRNRTIAATAISAFTALIALTAVASVADAGPPVHEENVQVFDEQIELCGLDVHFGGELRERVLWSVRRPGTPPYFGVRVAGNLVWTNVETGKSYTNIFNLNDKDLDITDNGDGTLTILVLVTGSDRYLGADGKLLFANPGQIRYEILIDHAGTPDDPTDDEFLEDLGLVKGSTGRNDTEGHDFCDDLIMVTGP